MRTDTRVLGLVGLLLALLTGATQMAPTWKTFKDLGDIFDKSSGFADKVKDAVEKTEDIQDAIDKLTDEDDEYDTDPNPPGMPKLPWPCDDDEDCERCFAKPHEELQDTRVRLEKLRRLNASTKAMIADNIAWGDAAAGVHGLAGLAWMKEKEGIREAERNFNASYDAKYQELMGLLETALQGIGACEDEVFGEQSWYERFGFIYYQFMVDRYLRTD